MFIVQNKYTDSGRVLDPLAWKRCRTTNPRLRVHLSSEGNSKKEILWQRRAPVKSIVYESPYAKVFGGGVRCGEGRAGHGRKG